MRNEKYPTSQWKMDPSKLPLTKYSSWNGCQANAKKGGKNIYRKYIIVQITPKKKLETKTNVLVILNPGQPTVSMSQQSAKLL